MLFFDKKPASETPWTRKLWIYDLRTNRHFTLKTDPLQRGDLDDFVACYLALNGTGTKGTAGLRGRSPTWSLDQPAGRWRAYDYEELLSRDKASLDIFWLKDESLEDAENLPAPELILQEIMEDLEGALAQLREMAGDLGSEA